MKADMTAANEKAGTSPEPADDAFVAVPAHQQVAPMQVSVFKLASFFSNCQTQSCLQHSQDIPPRRRHKTGPGNEVTMNVMTES